MMMKSIFFNQLRAGAYGYLTKNVFPSKLLASIKEVHNGGSPMSSNIARKVVSSFNHFRNPEPSLTKREREVLDLPLSRYKAIRSLLKTFTLALIRFDIT